MLRYHIANIAFPLAEVISCKQSISSCICARPPQVLVHTLVTLQYDLSCLQVK